MSRDPSLRELLEAVVSTWALPSTCLHGEEPDYCDGCRYAMEQAHGAAIQAARAALAVDPPAHPHQEQEAEAARVDDSPQPEELCTAASEGAAQPVVEWFSARQAILSAIEACHDAANDSERIARNTSLSSAMQSAASWRLTAAILRAFVRQYADADPSRPLEPGLPAAGRVSDAGDQGTHPAPETQSTPSPSPSEVPHAEALRELEQETHVAQAGSSRAWLAGSFVSAKANPGDVDVVFDVEGLDPEQLHPMLWRSHTKRPDDLTTRAEQAIRDAEDAVRLAALAVPGGREA